MTPVWRGKETEELSSQKECKWSSCFWLFGHRDWKHSEQTALRGTIVIFPFGFMDGIIEWNVSGVGSALILVSALIVLSGTSGRPQRLSEPVFPQSDANSHTTELGRPVEKINGIANVRFLAHGKNSRFVYLPLLAHRTVISTLSKVTEQSSSPGLEFLCGILELVNYLHWESCVLLALHFSGAFREWLICLALPLGFWSLILWGSIITVYYYLK